MKLLFCLLFLPSLLLAQEVSFEALKAISKQEESSFYYRSNRSSKTQVSTEYDIVYHRFDLSIDPAIQYISGSVTTYFKTSVPQQQIDFDLSSYLFVDSVLFHGNKCGYTHRNDHLIIDLIDSTASLDSITVFYKGAPAENSGGFGSFTTSEHEGAPVMWTLSEPFGARDWWPCKQTLNDKIDSTQITLTVPYGNTGVGNGMLTQTIHNGSFSTYTWKHKYPVTTYLIAIAVSNYELFQDTVEINGQDHLFEHYLYPETAEKRYEEARSVESFMDILSNKFTPYPFGREKYAHVQFSRRGGMEHQTISFMNSFGFDLTSHELAHHWFGNQITCGSWQDLWLNEGFATYCSGLCFEEIYPDSWWHVWKDVYSERIMSEPDGSVYVSDSTNNGRLFDARLTYGKGAFLLHMLRWVVGDENFFQGVNNYLQDSTLSYGYARTHHFIDHMEKASDTSLTTFFDQWFYGEGYPIYNISWQQNEAHELQIYIEQSTTHPSVKAFDMPLDFRFFGENTHSRVVRMNSTDSLFTFQLEESIDSIHFDPDHWLLGQSTVHPEVLAQIPLKVYPNPAHQSVIVREFDIKNPIQLIEVININGAILLSETFNNSQESEREINISNLENGFYLLRVYFKDQRKTEQSFIKFVN